MPMNSTITPLDTDRRRGRLTHLVRFRDWLGLWDKPGLLRLLFIFIVACVGFVACMGTESAVGSGSAEVDCGGSGETGLMGVGSSFISPKVNGDPLNHRA